MMKAALVAENYKIDIKDVAIPEIADNEILVEVKAVGICGSDVGGFFDKTPKSRRPGLIMGHEGAAVVSKVGKNVTNVKIGDRIAIDPQIYCGECFACKSGWTSICSSKKVTGSSLRGFVNGLLAEYAVIFDYQAFKIPDSLSFVTAAMIEPVSNAVHVVNRFNAELGETVVIIGAGALGLVILQAAKLKGLGKVVVVDVSDFRLEKAKLLGADVVINSSTEDTVQLINDLTNSKGADIVIEAAGLSVTYQLAIDIVRKRGTLIAFGALESKIDVTLLPILHKEINILGSTGANSHEVIYAIELLDKGVINVDPIITHHVKLKDTEEALYLFKDKKSNPIKVMITP